MSWLDRAFSLFTPRRAMTRTASRAAQRFMNDAADRWGRNTGNPDDARPRAFVDRVKAQRLVATNPYAIKGLNSLLNNVVGYGITGDPKGPKKVIDLWRAWTKVADFNGRLDLYGLQELAVRTMFVDGECFIIKRIVTGVPGIPLRLQVLSVDMIATEVSGTGIVSGIEYDADGRPAYYNFRRRRPGQPGNNLFGNPVRYAASDVVHLYRTEEVGQQRGDGIFAPVVKRLTDLDEYLDAEGVRKKIEACFAAFVTAAAGEEQTPLAKIEATPDSPAPSETFYPGMIEYLRPGETVEFGEPKALAGVGEFTRVMLLSTAAGLNTTYEHLTGDLSNVNYSSYRAGLLEFKRFVGRIQWLTVIPQLLNPVWLWVVAAGYQTGLFAKDTYEMKWTPAPFESLDPAKEAVGKLAYLAMGLENHRGLINEQGYDFEAHLAERAADNAAIKAAGLFFAGMDGRTTPSGGNDNGQDDTPPPAK